VLRRIFGPKKVEVAGGWRRLHSEDIYNLYTLTCTSRVIKSWKMRWAGHVALMREMRTAYNILVEKPVWKRPLGRPRRRWEDNIGMDLRKIGW